MSNKNHMLENNNLHEKITLYLGDKAISCKRYFLKLHPGPKQLYPVFMLIEEHETVVNHGGQIKEAYLKIKYSFMSYRSLHSTMDDRVHYFDAYYKPSGASLTGGAVFVDPAIYRGKKIGSYFLNVVIRWLQKFDDVPLNTIELVAHQATDENKARRNRLYEQFGITFNYDKDGLAGLSNPISTHQLNTTDRWQQSILVLESDELIDTLLKLYVDSNDVIESLRNTENEINRARLMPIRWCFYWLYIKLKSFVLNTK